MLKTELPIPDIRSSHFRETGMACRGSRSSSNGISASPFGPNLIRKTGPLSYGWLEYCIITRDHRVRLLRLLFLVVCLGCWPVSLSAQIAGPDDISGLAFWVDAQDVNGTGVQPANGATVTTWVDKSGNGRNLTIADGTVTFQATGFDAVNPGLRFPLGARMASENLFSGNFQNQMTVFFVNANNTITSNFSLSLNGTNTSSDIADGRFSFHTPWINNIVYFDAGACCDTTRLSGVFPNSLTETTLWTGLNDEPGNRQWLRIDGQEFRADTTGHNANVSRGMHIGDLPDGHTYDGRFAEIVVYNRALTLAEIQQVECYLLAKWKVGDVPAGCVQPLSVTKTSQVWNPSGANQFKTPGDDVLYQIVVSKPPSAGLTNNSIFVVDTLNTNTSFYNGDVDDGGAETNPISFSQAGSGLTFNYATDVGFSNEATAPATFAACTYVPIAGYDPNVRHICINPKGAFFGGPTMQSFTLVFRVKIN
jgi:hypothetical protein